MKILLLSSRFFGYSDRVKACLSVNHLVDSEYAYSMTYFDRIRRKLNITIPSYKKYYLSIIEKKRQNIYDRIIVLGAGSPYDFLLDLKKTHPESVFVLYMSADRRSYGFSDNYLRLFDRVLTYSYNDASEFNFEYRPWFYSNTKDSNKNIDICFIGSIHPSRLDILSSLDSYPLLSKYYYIYSDRMSYIKSAYKWRSLNKFIYFEGLQYSQYINILANSKATLDIPEQGQTNITTRPIEALGTKTKIITTNQFITRYNFYNHSNVFLIDKIDKNTFGNIFDWINVPYQNHSKELLDYYSLNTFCNELVR